MWPAPGRVLSGFRGRSVAWLMNDTQAGRAQAQLRAGVYGRLSETYDAAESVPIQLGRGADHARRRGWTVLEADDLRGGAAAG